MIRYITLSVYSMIITRVFIKLREKLLKYRYPEAQDKFIKSIGVDPVEYMYAVKCARVSDDMKIILWFEEYCDNGVRKMRYAEAGPSLGCVCDKLITKWCNDRLGTYGPYTFKFFDLQDHYWYNVTQQLTRMPIAPNDLSDRVALYSALRVGINQDKYTFYQSGTLNSEP